MDREKQLKQDFESACENIKQAKNLDNNTLLNLYGLFKQSTEGDCNISKPSFYDVKGIAKWNAWSDNKGLDASITMKRYIKEVNKILSNQ
jgi:diazepam-binding inhibitor (GABA receptor modulating acyl-CoA-binding protein)